MSPAITAREALKHLEREWVIVLDALREKAEREEKEQPKVTLFDMANHIQRGFTAAGACDVLPCPKCSAAFNTLNRLREEGPRFAANGYYHSDLVAWLRSLGVEPRP